MLWILRPGWIKKISSRLCPFTVMLNVIQVKSVSDSGPTPQTSYGHTVSRKHFLYRMLYPSFVQQVFVEHPLCPVTLPGTGITVNKTRRNPCLSGSLHYHGWRQKIRQISNIHSALEVCAVKKNKAGRGDREAGVGGSGLISSKNIKEALMGRWCLSILEGGQEASCAENGEGSGSTMTFKRVAAWETPMVWSSPILHLWDQIRAQLTSQS